MSCSNCNKSNCSCSDNCPNKASDITVFDCDVFNVIEIPCDASLCDALGLLESYTTNMVSELSTMTSVVITEPNCIDLVAGTYSIQQVIDAILVRLCTESSCPLFVEINQLSEKIIQAVASGGTPPYNYDWYFKDNIQVLSFGGATNVDTVDITGGTDVLALPTCIVTDDNGCQSSATFLWLQPGELRQKI